MTTVQIRKVTHRRLKEHADKLFPRQAFGDLVTVAVDFYLDHQKQSREASHDVEEYPRELSEP